MLSRHISSDDREYRRCKILHVVPLTSTYGFVKVIFHAALFVLICTLLMKPELIEQHEQHSKVFGCLCQARFSKNHHLSYENEKKAPGNDVSLVLEIKSLRSTVEKSELPEINLVSKHAMKERKISQLYWALLMTLFYLLFSLMLLHGIMSKNAPNMLPFLCLQFFDFVLDFLWLFGHFINTKNLHKLRVELRCLPFGKYLESLDPSMASFIVFAVCALVLLVQLYLISVVWSCYRYIQLRRCQLITSYRSSNTAHRNGGFWGLELWQVILSPKRSLRRKRLPKDMEEGLVEDLPNYEEVLKIPINKYNPPPYMESGKDGCEKKKEDKEDVEKK